MAVAAVALLLLCGVGLFCWRRRRKRAGAPPGTTTTTTARKGLFAESQMINVGPPPPGVAPPPALPPGWEQCVDPTSNEVYYYNASTGKTQWALPTS